MKAVFFLGNCLQANNLLRIDPKYRDLLLKKAPKTKDKEFSVERNYIDSIFNISQPSVSPLSLTPIPKPVEVAPAKISQSLPQKSFPKAQKSAREKDFLHRQEEILGSRSSIEENLVINEMKISQDGGNAPNNRTQTPTDSKETNTNTTLNSTIRPGSTQQPNSTIAADFIVKVFIIR